MDHNINPVAPAPRMPLQLGIDFRRSYARRSEQGRLKNISLTGAFLEFGEIQQLAPQEKIIIEFIVSGRKRKIQASVIWNNTGGCGVKFHHTNNRDRQIVDDLMYFVENSRSSQRTVLDTIFKKVA